MAADGGNTGSVRRRLRGMEIPAPSPIHWRHQRRLKARELSGRTAPHQDAPAIGIGRLRLDIDAACTFAVLLPMIFIAQFGSLGAAAIVGVTPIYALLRRRDLWSILCSRLCLLWLPLLALCSVLWSWLPAETLKFAVELCVTVLAALLIGSSRNQNAVIKAMALSFLVYAAAAVIVGRHVAVGMSGRVAFSGLTESKNLMADIAGFGLLVSICTLLISLRQRAVGWVLLCGVAALIQIYALVTARSAGALLAVVVALAAMSALTSLSGLGRTVRGAFTAAIGVVVMVVALNYVVISTALIQFASDVFNKDPTLTGRRYLWYRANDIIHSTHLGVGYSAFWIQGNLDAEGLWRYAGIADRSGFNFHNAFVDLLVMLGWAGAIAMALTLLIGSTFLVRRFVERPTMSLIFWVTILLYIASRMPIETLGIQQLSHSTLLLFAALSAGLVNTRPSAMTIGYNLPTLPTMSNIDYARSSAIRTSRISFGPRISYGARLRVRAETLDSRHIATDLSPPSSPD